MGHPQESKILYLYIVYLLFANIKSTALAALVPPDVKTPNNILVYLFKLGSTKIINKPHCKIITIYYIIRYRGTLDAYFNWTFYTVFYDVCL